MFSGVFASFEGFLPNQLTPIINNIINNGGFVSDMLTLSTTHLIVNEKRQQGFQEVRCTSGAHQAWIINEYFIQESIKAGIKLPEFQFTVKRLTNQDELDPPLENYDDDEFSFDSFSNINQSNIENDIIPELEDIINNSEGGQVWCTEGTDSYFKQIQVRYVLGPANNKNNDNNINNNIIKSHKISQNNHHKTKKKKVKQKNGKRTKVSIRKYALKHKNNTLIQDNNNIKTSNIHKDEIIRSDEELFICASPWNNNTVMVSKQGKLWFKVGKYNPYIMLHQPTNPICSVVCGKSHALALTISGQVYSWGSSYNGQLGHGDLLSKSNPTRIQRVLGNIPIIQISAIADSSAALTRLGGVYMWGGNRDGKLGTCNQKHSSPILIHFPDNFETLYGSLCQIICGNTHSMALTDQGYLFSWGSNRYGQLGRETKNPFSSQPEIIPSLSNILSASCGLFHSAAVDNEGNIYSWGLARKGALGHGSDSQNESLPRKIQWFTDNKYEICSVQCGDYITCCTEGNTGEVYICGCVDTNIQFLYPIQIPQVFSVTDIYCNKSRITMIIRDSNVLLQRHAIEGNIEPLQALLRYLSLNSLDFINNLHTIKTKDGNTLLHLACLFNQPHIIEYILLKYENIDTNIENNEGYAPIHICAQFNRVDCLKHLLLHPNTNINQLDKKLENSALHICILSYSEACMKLLVYYGAEKSIFNRKGYTPLHLAIKSNNNPIYSQFLVSHAASIIDKDKKKQTPLEYCSWGQRLGLKQIAETNEIFISYAHIDLDFALKLRKALNCYSLRCWMDDWRLEAGGDWRTAIGNGLIGAKIVLFIASKNSIISDWCLKELYLAIELHRKIIIIFQEDISDNIPLLDIQMASLISHTKSKDIFNYTDIQTTSILYKNTTEQLARRCYGLLESYKGIKNEKSLKLEENIKNQDIINPRKLLSKKSLYVCFGYLESDKTFIEYIQSHLKDHRIKSINSMNISKDLDERFVISNAWCYILILSPKILQNDIIQQHLLWIESSSNVNLILLYFDPDKDYMDLFPKRSFSNEQLRKISELFSFCINDSPWLNQLLYTLNLLRKQSLLDRHLDLLMKRLEDYRQQTAQLDAQISLLQQGTMNNNIQSSSNNIVSV